MLYNIVDLMSAELPPGNDLLFMAQEEPGEISRTATIKTVGDAVTSSGKPYKVIEFADGRKVRSFNPKQAESLSPGMEVEYGLRRNEKTGYWDLTGIKRAEPRATSNGESERPPTEPVGERGRERFLDDRERSMRSMNALTNATTLLAALIDKEIVKPSGVDQACAMVGDLHHRLLVMHDPQPQGEDGT